MLDFSPSLRLFKKYLGLVEKHEIPYESHYIERTV
jgi:hypothetical protein